MTLQEQANTIIMQKGHTPDDITELCRIRWLMSMKYSNLSLQAASMEQKYELAKPSRYIAYKQKMKASDNKYTDEDAKRVSRQESEDLF